MTMRKVDFIVRSLDDTQALAERIATKLNHQGIVALTGNLGSGKTTFTQLLAKHLGITADVTSPTFTLVQEYPIKDSWLIHADLYRLRDDEIPQLGLDDYFNQPKTLVLVEWADRAAHIFPENTLWLNFTLTSDHRVVSATTQDDELWSRLATELTL